VRRLLLLQWPALCMGVVVQPHGLHRHRIVQPGRGEHDGAVLGVAGTRTMARWSCRRAMATFIVNAARPRLSTWGCGQPSTAAVCSVSASVIQAWRAL
jgi:hypothetical protein